MTVCELIEKLQQEDPDRIVVCQADPEGNGYALLEGCWVSVVQSTV